LSSKKKRKSANKKISDSDKMKKIIDQIPLEIPEEIEPVDQQDNNEDMIEEIE